METGIEEFTEPSPDRVAAAAELATGSRALSDEVIVAVGTTKQPGDLAMGTDIANLVGASVTGGWRN